MFSKLKSLMANRLTVARSNVPEGFSKPGTFRGHHPIFKEFEPFSGQAPPGVEVDFIGSKTSSLYRSSSPSNISSYVETTIPPVDEEYFEWIDVLTSVKDGSDLYTVVELGAGYGRWGVRCGLAAKARGISEVRLIFAEPEPAHVKWLAEHVRENGFTSDEVEIIDGAVSDSDGVVEFYVGMPQNFDEDTPREWYGQAIAQAYEQPEDQDGGEHAAPDTYFGVPVKKYKSGYSAIQIRKYDIKNLMPSWGMIDLMDLDVQGEELKVIGRAMEEINAQTKRLHIGTHSHEIEDGLRDLLKKNQWLCMHDYPCQSKTPTAFGEVNFVDGVQSWINPRLRDTRS